MIISKAKILMENVFLKLSETTGCLYENTKDNRCIDTKTQDDLANTTEVQTVREGKGAMETHRKQVKQREIRT